MKITGFEFFGHSNKACWMFDYSSNMDSASKCWLHENDLKKINRGIFARDAFIKTGKNSRLGSGVRALGGAAFGPP